MVTKIKDNILAPDMIGGIIQYIEEQPIDNTDWIESINISKDNTWTVTIKPKASYYPKTIIKYVNKYKTRIITGKLFEIENILTT
ncbi:MAG: hypothetical protein IJ880_13800 [Bacilli bacterium]|nr:hypothetical protein [Bacilli bacterium]